MGVHALVEALEFLNHIIRVFSFLWHIVGFLAEYSLGNQ